MASTTSENLYLRALIACCALLVAAPAAIAADPAIAAGAIGMSPKGASEGAMAMGASIGRLAEALTTIFGIYYSFKSVLIYLRMASGKAQGQGETFGGMMSHFVAGVLAYHSRTFFQVVHNTVPMIPDFGKLVYDAELWRSLMS